MYIFRIQQRGKNKVGAYSIYYGDSTVGSLLSRFGSTETHPSPMRDTVIGPYWEELSYTQRSRYYFGFSKPSHLLDWFLEHDLYASIDDDFNAVVAVYEVSDACVMTSDVQAIFQLDEAVKVKEYQLHAFHQLCTDLSENEVLEHIKELVDIAHEKDMANKLRLLDSILADKTPDELFNELNQYDAVGPRAVDFLEDV